MGIVRNRSEAEASLCSCIRINPSKGDEPENLLCHVDGIIGWTSDGQEERFCESAVVKNPSEEYSEHIRKFKEFSEISDKCLEEEVKDTWVCVEREAEKKQ